MEPAVAKEEDIADAVEVREVEVNWLARHVDDFWLPETFRKVALEQMLVGGTPRRLRVMGG